MRRIYVAGPYTKGDVAQNVAEAMKATHELFDLGCAAFTPHLSHFLHIAHARPYEFWTKHDLEWLPQCHAVLRLHGQSSGADIEEACARRLGLPVFRTLGDLEAWRREL